MAINNFKTISELSALQVPLRADDKLLVSRPPNSNDSSNFVSYSAPLTSILSCVSAAISADLCAAIKYGMKELTGYAVSDLEYPANARDSANRNGHEWLTTYVPVRLSSLNDIENTDAKGYSAKVASKSWHAISAVSWNENRCLKVTGQINLDDVVVSAMSRVNSKLKDLGLDKGVLVEKNISVGTKIAEINKKPLWSGDPKKMIDILSKTSIGDTIATVIYKNDAGKPSTITIKNNLNVLSKSNTGDIVAYINNTAIRNNLSVNLTTAAGDIIANINGKNIKNGLKVDSKSDTGSIIASINGTSIRNGFVLAGVQTKGNTICTINGQAIHNNLQVIDSTNGTNQGRQIADLGGVKIYNGVVLTQDATLHKSWLNGVEILGGIKLGSIQQRTTAGTRIATILSEGNKLTDIYNGVNEQAIYNSITNSVNTAYKTLDTKIDNLKTEIYNNFLYKPDPGYLQVVAGRVKFNQIVEGKITNASYADTANTANWATYAKHAYWS